MTADRTFLVTGASGFTGGWLVRLLREQGLKVRAMVRDHRKAVELEGLGAEVVEGDLSDRASLDKAVRGVYGVYHIAALFRQAGLPDQVYFDVNRDGVRRMLDVSIQNGVQRFVHCSTIGVLGHVSNPPADETTPYNPGDVYQRSKMEGEQVALDYFTRGLIRGVVIRPGMIFGPGDGRTLKIFSMIAKRRFFFVGRGEAFVHFVDVRDLVRAFRSAMDKTELSNQVYIIAGRRALALREFTQIVAAQLGVKPPWLCVPVKPMQVLGSICEAVCTPLGINPPLYRRRVDFYTKSRHFTTSKAERDLGYSPAQNLEGELHDIIAWYRCHGMLPALKRSRMVRAVDGSISDWDETAEQLYGWQKGEALGTVSHSLLKTEFPEPLARINEQLLNKKVWEGQLVHQTRIGKKVKVASRWELVSNSTGGVEQVLEVNSPAEWLEGVPTAGISGGVIKQWVGGVMLPLCENFL